MKGELAARQRGDSPLHTMLTQNTSLVLEVSIRAHRKPLSPEVGGMATMRFHNAMRSAVEDLRDVEGRQIKTTCVMKSTMVQNDNVPFPTPSHEELRLL